MRAVGLYKYLPIDNPESLVDVDVPTPEPAPRDLLVKVKAVSVNPVDTKVRSPKDKVEAAPRVLGWDAAGIVERVGGAVSFFKPGDEVYYAGSITRPGCNSEYHAVDERIVGRKPRNLSFEEAAAMPLTTITAWEALFDRMAIPLATLAPDDTGEVSVGSAPEVASAFRRTSGHSLLIIGGAGGVGSIAIQLAKVLAGMRVIATASRPESAKWAPLLLANLAKASPSSPSSSSSASNAVDYSAPANAPFSAEEVSIPVSTYALAGTLLLPKSGKRPFTAVVMITGSGLQTRDSRIPMPGLEQYAPFRQIAERLASNGVAVLRVDDRGIGGSTGRETLEKATTTSLAEDTRAQIAWLRTRADIDGARIIVVGHSEGASIASMIGASDPKLFAVVMMAGPGKRGGDIAIEQQEDMLRSDTTAGSPAGSRCVVFRVC